MHIIIENNEIKYLKSYYSSNVWKFIFLFYNNVNFNSIIFNMAIN